MLKKQIEERTVNILKRMTFKYFYIITIDNVTSNNKITVLLVNTVTNEEYEVSFSYEMLHYLSEEGMLKYNIIKDMILTNIIEGKDELE